MRPITLKAKRCPKRIVFAEGEEERVLQAVQIMVDEKITKPILIGRPSVIENRIERYKLRIKPGQDFDITNPDYDPRYREYWEEYHRLTERKGVSQQYAKIEMRRRHTLIGAMMLHREEADGMICGTFGTHKLHLHYIDQVIGRKPGVNNYYAMNMLMLPKRTIFICDTYVHYDPTAEQIFEMTLLAAEEIRRFGLTPKVALLSHSSFGSSNHPSGEKMRKALDLISNAEPELEIEGEMHGDAALSESVRLHEFPRSRLKGEANLLIMPTLDAANISFNLLKTAAGHDVTIGPMLLGCAKPIHILTPTSTVRRIINMTALTVVEAQSGNDL
jgi:malate dehydrogenase (oxaloacetate-decarboxylating)(NADP+)